MTSIILQIPVALLNEAGDKCIVIPPGTVWKVVRPPSNVTLDLNLYILTDKFFFSCSKLDNSTITQPLVEATSIYGLVLETVKENKCITTHIEGRSYGLNIIGKVCEGAFVWDGEQV